MGVVVKNALVVLLVVVVVMTGLPVLMGMSGMAACQDCGPAVLVGAGCAAAVLAAGVAIALGLVSQRLRVRRDALRLLLLGFLLERPPQLA